MPTTTSSLAGDRNRRSRNPRDLTGREYQRLHAQEAAKREAAAENVNIHAVKRDAFTSGHAAGYEAGVEAGLDAATEALLSLSEKDLLAKRAAYIAEFGTEAGE
jgi:flagellar biosynthesis/type III secretory pathway protein FliH